jgi:hypothetical protein
MPPILQLISKGFHDFPFLDEEGLNVVLHASPTHLRSRDGSP